MSKDKWYEDWLKSVGVGVPLDEFKKTLIDREYVEIKNVKNFSFYNKTLENIDTLIILKHENGWWSPKISGGGCSGYSGDKPKWIGSESIHNLGLTAKEMKKFLKQFPEFGKTIRLEKCETTCGDKTEKVVCAVGYRSDCPYNRFREVMDSLRDFANEKFSKENKTRTISFEINGMPFQYTSKITETISESKEDLSYAFYLYNEKGESVESFNYGAIYG